MSKIVETRDGSYELNIDFEKTVVAKPVEGTVYVEGLPAKQTIAEALTSALHAVTRRDLPDSLSVDRVEEAMEALVYIRVLQIRNNWVKGFDDLHYREICYPAFMFPVLRSIGDIDDDADGVNFKVKVAGDLERFADQKYDWLKVSETLRDLRNYGVKNGLELAEAMPKAKDGQLSVMTFMIGDDKRLSSHTSLKSPADAVLRAALGFQFSEYVWGTARWEYNTVSFYQHHLRKIVTDSIRAL